MRLFSFVLLASLVPLVTLACDEDKGEVRPRNDAGVTFTPGGGVLACGVAIPTTYVGAAFTANAAVEIALGKQIAILDAKITDSEGTNDVTFTAQDLKDIYGGGTPSLRAVGTPQLQTAVEADFDLLGGLAGKTWQPSDATKDGGATTGGKFGAFWFSPIGVDLHVTPVRTMLGAMYNDVLGVIAAPMTDASVDRLLAAFGGTPDGKNTLLASLAVGRPGFGKVMNALLVMKAAVTNAACKADLDGALTTYRTEWEKATFGAAITKLSLASATAADPTKGPDALHAYGEALGLVQGFQTIAASSRKISDAQLTSLLDKMGATTPFVLATDAGTRAQQLTGAINDIGLYEGFTADEIAALEKSL